MTYRKWVERLRTHGVHLSYVERVIADRAWQRGADEAYTTGYYWAAVAFVLGFVLGRLTGLLQ
jgi:hypothetical protein